MRVSAWWICAVLVFGAVPSALAQKNQPSAEIKAETDKQIVSTDDLVTCKITVTSSQRDLAQPQLPDFKGFAVVSQAQSSTVTVKSAAVNTVLVFVFVLMPVETGFLTIGPATVTVEGKNYSSQPVTVEVKPGKRQPAVPRSDLPRYSL